MSASWVRGFCRKGERVAHSCIAALKPFRDKQTGSNSPCESLPSHYSRPLPHGMVTYETEINLWWHLQYVCIFI